MADSIIRSIAAFASEQAKQELPSGVAEAGVRRLLDTVACAIGGMDTPVAAIATAVSPRLSDGPPNVIGSEHPTTPQMAAFANTCMIRALDFNDCWPGGHPSDTLGPLLAMPVDGSERSGRNLIRALVSAYEVFIRISDAADLRRKGWDQGYAVGLAAVAGLGTLHSMSEDEIANAMSIIATANVPLRATRAGTLSLWKGAATAFAAQNAVLATQLARGGMTGPEAPITGRHGLWDQITGEFELQPFPTAGGRYVIDECIFKYWPVEFNAQLAVWAARRLRAVLPLERLRHVHLGTYWSAWHEIGSESAKWRPLTRETADHSMPYIFIRAMQRGELGLDDFEATHYRSTEIHDLMTRVSVSVDDEAESRFPETFILKVTAEPINGDPITFVETNPKGTPSNPMTMQDIRDKFLQLAGPQYGLDHSTSLVEYWSTLNDQDSVETGMRLLGSDPRLVEGTL